jgi:long-chain acyl-CoA synthetase
MALATTGRIARCFAKYDEAESRSEAGLRGEHMDRIWLKHYPQGVPAEIDTSEYPSLVSLFEESFTKNRERTAFICMDKALTYGQLDEMSRAFAAWLQSKGLAKGARVAIMMPNVLQYPVAIIAILRAGYTVVNVNPLYTARELEGQLKDAGAEAIIVLENFAHTLQQALGRTNIKHIVVAAMGDLLGIVKGTIVNLVVRRVKKMVPAYSLPNPTSFNATIAAGSGMTLNKPQIGPEDIAFLQYTGGTTGVAKGAMLLHRNVVANALQIDAWLQPALETPPKVDRLTIVAALPLYHIFALTACFLLSVRTGGQCILIPNPRDIPNLLKELAKYEVHNFPAVNTLYNALLNHPDFGKVNWSKLKCAVGGGMAVHRSVAERWFKTTGHPILEGYGLSETSPVLTCNLPMATEWNGTIGLPMPSTDISIRNDDNREMPLGEPGEICARGPQVMPGYWNRPDETANAMTGDGYFRTGDIGMMDEVGQIRIVDRKKDMISVSGFKVYPSEVEAVVASHPGVLECAVVGIPDARSGEAVKLFAVKKDSNLTEAELMAYCRTQLTSYKVPRSIEFRADLPKTNIGKVLRRQLRDQAQAAETQAA